MSVYDLYQSYLNAQKQVAPSLGILDPRLLYPQNYQGVYQTTSFPVLSEYVADPFFYWLNNYHPAHSFHW